MPRQIQLTGESISAIGSRLEAKRRALRSAVAELKADNTPAGVERYHHSQQRLVAVTAAIRRLDNGSFGMCTMCDRHVYATRLEAMPTTVLCRACADRQARSSVR